jgi:nucleotide-binding universal stress UspA family protein
MTFSAPTVVVGYDGSPASHAAVAHALDAVGLAGTLIVVHTYNPPVEIVGAGAYAALVDDTGKAANELVDALERDCERLAGIAYERHVTLGFPAEAICKIAEKRNADKIVLGSRGVGRLRGLVGSVAHDVIHRAHCPVLVIPERMVAHEASVRGTLPAA